MKLQVEFIREGELTAEHLWEKFVAYSIIFGGTCGAAHLVN